MQTVSELRKEGLLDEALAQVERSLAKKPDNIIAKRDKAWILQDMMSSYSSPYTSVDFAEKLDAFVAINLPGEEVIIYDNLTWIVSKFLMELSKQERDDEDFIFPDPFIEVMKKLPLSKPSESYTFLLRAVAVHQEYYKEFPSFFIWWGPENFREEDFAPRGKEGELDSFVESVLYPIAKVWFDEEAEKPSSSTLDAFIIAFQKAFDAHPRHIKLAHYYLSRLYFIQGNKDKALELILAILRYKRTEYLTWEMLGDIVEDEDLKISAYCKAVNCKVKHSYLFRVREKLVDLLVARGMYREAKTSMLFQLKMYDRLGREIPEHIQTLIKEEWYVNALSLAHNEDMYVEFLPKAEALIFTEIKEQQAVITGVKHEKSLAYVRVSKTIESSFIMDGTVRYLKGDVVAVRLERKVGKTGLWYKTLSCRRSDGRPKRTIYKKFEGVLPKDIERGTYMSTVFVDGRLIENCGKKAGDTISGAAIAIYNATTDVWSWRAVKINA